MATIKLPKGTSLDIEKIYVRVECPRCEANVRFHMKRPVTMKVCQTCSKVSFIFTIVPLPGAVSVTCVAMNGVFPVEMEIKSTDVQIDPAE